MIEGGPQQACIHLPRGASLSCLADSIDVQGGIYAPTARPDGYGDANCEQNDAYHIRVSDGPYHILKMHARVKKFPAWDVTTKIFHTLICFESF